jgi:ubiquinol-cytochrome c reductase iron-sulfur subunit
MTAIVQDNVDEKRRRLLLVATFGRSGCQGAACAVPFLASWLPSARALAAGAPVEADISKIEAGQQITIEWRGKPVWILQRTPEMLAQLPKNTGPPRGPGVQGRRAAGLREGPGALHQARALRATGVCTHLGCSPTLKKEIGAASDMGADWPGGYYCPCHNSRFDLAARVLQGSPAPKNLAIPPHRYAATRSW